MGAPIPRGMILVIAVVAVAVSMATPSVKGQPGRVTCAGGYLLIPDSRAKTLGMYDPFNGSYIGDVIAGYSGFNTPIDAILGPDGNIYVSDQMADSIFVFDISGNYLYTYADSSDNLVNVRGIDFRGGHLFVTSGDEYVAEFSGPHTRLSNFIDDGTEPFDILFLEDGRCLLTDIAGFQDNVRLYNSDGTLAYELFKINFPEQVQFDPLKPGDFLVASFKEAMVYDFNIDGSIMQTTPVPNAGRGAYRLGNGNLLITNYYGVWEVDPEAGTVLQQEYSGSCRFIEPVPALTVDTDTLSSSQGGIATFNLYTRFNLAGRKYALLGTASGTSPGTILPGGGILPLNRDFVYYYIRYHLNGPRFQNFFGKLGPNGEATAVFNSIGPLSPSVPVGTILNFAFSTIAPFDFQSNYVAIEVVP